MDVRHLALLRELAERGSIAAVAEATHRTPSAVSQQLRTARRELGLPLVEPDGRGVRLTDAGRLLAQGAVGVQEAIAEVEARLAEFTGRPSGTVTVAALASAAEYLLPRACVALAGQQIEIRCADLDLAEADFASLAADHDVVVGHSLVGETPAGAGRLHRTVLAREPVDVAVPAGHPLAARERLTPADVVDEPWIAVPPGYPFGEILRAVELATGREARRVQEVRDNRLKEAFVVAGLGLGLLPRFTTRERPGLVLRPLAGVPATRWVVAMSRPDRARRAVVRRVVAALRDAAAAVAPAPGG